MKKPLLILAALLCTFIGWAQNTAISSGAWETGANWSLGHAPLATENVIIPSPFSMTVNANDVCLSLTINSGATVTIIGAQNLSIAGNFANAGTFTASTAGSSLTFNATSNSILSGAGTYTFAGTVVLAMGAKATSLDVQSANFCNALTGSFTLTQGTWIMDNGGTIVNMYTNNTPTQFIIPNTVVMQSNAGAMYFGNNATEGNLLLEGTLFMNGGIVATACNQGYNAGIDFEYHVVGGISPALIFTNGVLYVFAGFNWNTNADYINFNMSGGTMFCAYSQGSIHGGYSNDATFCLQNVFGGQTVMTGGAIVLQDADNSPVDNDLDMGGANVAATNYSVTGGQVQFGYINTQGSSTFFGIQPYPTTNYPNLNFQSGTAKDASPYFSSNSMNIMSLFINPNMTWSATPYNNGVNFTYIAAGYSFDDQGTFQPGAGTYTFDGPVPQVMTGTVTIPFYNVAINNANGVTMTTPATVSGTLTLTNGLLNTTNPDMPTILAGAAASVGSPSTYVNGPMAKTGNTAFTFPIGASGRFMPLGISAPAHITNTITTYYTRATPINPTSVNAPLTNVSLLEYWTISETVSGDAVDVTLYWQHGPTSGIYAYNNTLHVADYTGAAWNDLGESAVAGIYPGAGDVTASSTITNFTNLPVTFGSLNGNINPLPITLTSFTANYAVETNSVLASWTVASQLNNKEFIVEKTLDGTNYQEVATVQGAGTTPFTESYSAVDPNPTPGLSYYRLKQIDMDGTPTVFSPVPIFIETPQSNNTINLYPNPVSSNATLNYNSTDKNKILIDIIDASGKTVRSFALANIEDGENNFTLNTAGLSSGIYLLRATGAQKVNTLKFIKQ